MAVDAKNKAKGDSLIYSDKVEKIMAQTSGDGSGEDKASYEPFPAFAGADRRYNLMFPEGTTDEIGADIGTLYDCEESNNETRLAGEVGGVLVHEPELEQEITAETKINKGENGCSDICDSTLISEFEHLLETGQEEA